MLVESLPPSILLSVHSSPPPSLWWCVGCRDSPRALTHCAHLHDVSLPTPPATSCHSPLHLSTLADPLPQFLLFLNSFLGVLLS